jgi:hypothetical protein
MATAPNPRANDNEPPVNRADSEDDESLPSDDDDGNTTDEAPPPGHQYGRRLTITVYHARHFDRRLVTYTSIHHMRERVPLYMLACQLMWMTGEQEVLLVENCEFPGGLTALRELDHQSAPIDYEFGIEHEIYFFIPDGYPDPPFGGAAAADPGSDDDYLFEIPIHPNASIIESPWASEAAPTGSNCQNSPAPGDGVAVTDNDAPNTDSTVTTATAACSQRVPTKAGSCSTVVPAAMSNSGNLRLILEHRVHLFDSEAFSGLPAS